MTIKEASHTAVQSTYTTSSGDNINKVCYRIYGVVDETLKLSLTKINKRFDWEDIAPGEILIYYHRNIMIQIV